MTSGAKLISIAVLVGLAGCHRANAEPPPPPPSGEVVVSSQQIDASKITVEAVGEREIDTTLITSGKIAFDDLRVAHVFSPVTGRVTQILANPGEFVKKGQRLAIIDSPDVGVATSDVDKALADAIAADHELDRQRSMFADGAAAKKEVEAAEDNARRAKAELQRARAKARMLHAGDAVSQFYTLTAPIDGEVVARAVNPAQEVQGQYGGGTAIELFTLGDLHQVWVVADVFEQDLPRVEKGQTVDVEVVSRKREPFHGVVDWVASALDPATRTAKIRCTLENDKALLKPEMFATVTLHVPGKKELALPRSAVLRLGEQAVVHVEAGPAQNGGVRFVRRPVKVDDEGTGDFVRVIEGVKAGERVVTSGSLLLSSS